MANGTLRRGFSVVEILFGAAIMTTVLIGIASTFNLFLATGLQNTQKIQSALYAEEALEVSRFLRDAGWDANIAPLSTTTPHNAVYQSGAWSFSTTSFSVGNFTRTVWFQDAYRDGASALVEAGGTLDPNVRRLTVEVSWPGAATSTRVTTYLTDLLGN